MESEQRALEEYAPTVGNDRRDGAVVVGYGYRQVFECTISRFASFAEAFSFVSIATGVFAADLEPPVEPVC